MEYYKRIITECEVHYDVDGYDSYEKIENFAFALADRHNVKCMNTGPGPDWEAYILIKGGSEVETEKAAKKLVRYIKRFKNHKLY